MVPFRDPRPSAADDFEVAVSGSGEGRIPSVRTIILPGFTAEMCEALETLIPVMSFFGRRDEDAFLRELLEQRLPAC